MGGKDRPPGEDGRQTASDAGAPEPGQAPPGPVGTSDASARAQAGKRRKSPRKKPGTNVGGMSGGPRETLSHPPAHWLEHIRRRASIEIDHKLGLAVSPTQIHNLDMNIGILFLKTGNN